MTEPASERETSRPPRQLPRELSAITLGSPARFTGAEIAAEARIPLEDARRIWRAMGFPDMGGARGFTEADLSALMRLVGMMRRGLLDLDAAIELARSFGQTTSRLAEWQADTIGRHLVAGEGDADPGAEARDGITDLLPEFEMLLLYVWRRHLAAVLGRMWDDGEDAAEFSDTATVGFADLVSFTRLTKQLDREALAALVQSFETAAADVVHAAGGRLVKTLGDEVMFVTESADVAAQIALRLHELSASDLDIPPMRVGLATGPVLNRMGDVFGATVNRASRLTASAKPGSTLVDSETAEVLASQSANRYSVRAQAPRPIRGLGIMRPYALSARRAKQPEDQSLAASAGSGAGS